MHTPIRLTAPIVAALLALATLIAPAPAFASSCVSAVLQQQTSWGSDSTTTAVTFTGLSAAGPSGCTYTNLRITGQLRSTYTASQPYMQVSLGGTSLDGAAHYTVIGVGDYNGVSPYAISSVGATSMRFCDMPGNANAGASTTFEILIPNAFNAQLDKEVIVRCSYGLNSGGARTDDIEMFSGEWYPTSEVAIQTLGLALSSGYFAAGSTISVFVE